MKNKWFVLAGVVLALSVLVSAAVAHRGERMRNVPHSVAHEPTQEQRAEQRANQ